MQDLYHQPWDPLSGRLMASEVRHFRLPALRDSLDFLAFALPAARRGC